MSNPSPFFDVSFDQLPDAPPLHHVNVVIADNDVLAKQGKVGKWIANHRVLTTYLIAAIGLFGVGMILYSILGFVYGSIWSVAAGQNYGFFATQLASDTVIINGDAVLRVIEPKALISTRTHALLVEEYMREIRAKPFTRAEVAKGYGSWFASRSEGIHNYTFKAAENLASTFISKEKPCVCFYELGLPINAVYIENIGMYEPRCEDRKSDADIVIPGRDRGSFYTLYRDAITFMSTEYESRFDYQDLKTKPMGTVDYIAISGYQSRLVIKDQSTYVCIKNCLFRQE